MTIDDGGPAFPVNGPNGDHPGMSLRDWFAGMAMQGMYAATKRTTEGHMSWPNESACARWSYQQADAMLAARKREETQQ